MNFYKHIDNDLQPIWRGNTVYRESFMPVTQEDFPEITIPLLYPIDHMLKLESATLVTAYAEERDYAVRDGRLIIPSGSAIRVIPWNEYNPSQPTDEQAFICSTGGYLAFSEDGRFHKKQYAVTYRHSGYWQGTKPVCAAGELPKTKQRLREHAAFTVGFLGDSITYGCNASGMLEPPLPPYMPIWPMLVTERLRRQYDCNVRNVNKAVGGTVSAWGAEQATSLFREDVPDLMVIGFGMNDGSAEVRPLIYQANIRSIMEQMLALNPRCEFILVCTTLPNPLAAQFYREQHEAYVPMLKELAAAYGGCTALMPMTDIHRFLLTKKKFWDMTGNNINHPNDFLIRIYAQAFLELLHDE